MANINDQKVGEYTLGQIIDMARMLQAVENKKNTEKKKEKENYKRKYKKLDQSWREEEKEKRKKLDDKIIAMYKKGMSAKKIYTEIDRKRSISHIYSVIEMHFLI